jgi:DNA-binding response OmpR family regulator
MKLLIVEDNHLLATSVRSNLKATFTVDIASNGSKGIDLATATEYGIIVLDLGLPDMDGQQVCRTIREHGVNTPILVATGEKDPTHCIRLLDCGADDYITKPYNIDVLQARIRALLRRNLPLSYNAVTQFGELTLDTQTRQAHRSGKYLDLRKKEFDILEYLLQNRGHVVTRTMIHDHVWESDQEAWNNTVDVHIKYLRDKVDKPFAEPLIKTVYGVGYMVDNTG